MISKESDTTYFGHIAFWNGTAWTDGGEYATTKQVKEISTLLSNNKINIIADEYKYNGYLSNIGIKNDNQYKYAKVPVNENSVYYLHRECEIYANVDYIGFYNDDAIISIRTCGNTINENGKVFEEIETPENCNYVVFNLKLANYDESNSSRFSIYPTILDLLGYDYNVAEKVKNMNVLPLLSASQINLLLDNYKYIGFVSNRGIQNGANYKYAKIPVKSENIYYIHRSNEIYSVDDFIAFYNNNELLNVIRCGNTEINNGYVFEKIETPENCNYVAFNLKINAYDESNTSKFLTYPTLLDFYGCDSEVRNILNTTNRLNSKTWLVIGDSITESNFRATKNYHGYIADRTGCHIVNEGHSGKGYINGQNSSSSMCDYCDALTGEEGYNYITIFAGTNDIGSNLGEFTDTNKNSIYGAIRYCINSLLSSYPNAKIGLITPLPRANYYGKGTDLEKISDAIVEIANNYSIPVLDLYHNSGLRPWNNENNATYFSCTSSPSGDGLHPNALGHEWISHAIQDWLEKI